MDGENGRCRDPNCPDCQEWAHCRRTRQRNRAAAAGPEPRLFGRPAAGIRRPAVVIDQVFYSVRTESARTAPLRSSADPQHLTQAPRPLWTFRHPQCHRTAPDPDRPHPCPKAAWFWPPQRPLCQLRVTTSLFRSLLRGGIRHDKPHSKSKRNPPRAGRWARMFQPRICALPWTNRM